MPTIADITGAGHPGRDEAFAVAGQAAKGNNRAILPGRKQAV